MDIKATMARVADEVRYVEDCLADINERAAEDGSLAEDDAKAFAAGVAFREEGRAKLADLEARAAVLEARTTRIDVPGQINKPTERDVYDISDIRYGAPVGEVRDRGARAIDATRGLSDEQKAQADRVMRSAEGDRDGAVARHIVATGNPEYRSAFVKALGGQADMWTNEERAAVSAVRAASLTDANGGFAVPFTLDTTIIDTGSHSTNPFRAISRVVQTTTDSWNGVSSAGVTASWDGEAVEVSDDAPTLAQPSIPVFKGAAFVPFSIEVGQDWAGMEADVRGMIMRAKDDLEGAAFVSGNGTSAPQGVTTALDGTASEIAPATAEAFAVADVYALESALESRYGSNASWVAHKIWFNAIRQFDTAGGSALWEFLGGARPSQLLGYDAYESSDMDAVLPNAAATADNFGLLFGDFSNYVIVDRVGMSVELIPHLFATANNRPSGQRGFYAHWRTGAEVVNTAGIKMLSIPTTA
jgi:HK97 family phage major capsid protein